jgi:hypothetical protein
MVESYAKVKNNCESNCHSDTFDTFQTVSNI